MLNILSPSVHPSASQDLLCTGQHFGTVMTPTFGAMMTPSVLSVLHGALLYLRRRFSGRRPSLRPSRLFRSVLSFIPSRPGHGAEAAEAIPARRAPPAGRPVRRGAWPGPGAAGTSGPGGEQTSSSASPNPPGQTNPLTPPAVLARELFFIPAQEG